MAYFWTSKFWKAVSSPAPFRLALFLTSSFVPEFPRFLPFSSCTRFIFDTTTTPSKISPYNFSYIFPPSKIFEVYPFSWSLVMIILIPRKFCVYYVLDTDLSVPKELFRSIITFILSTEFIQEVSALDVEHPFTSIENHVPHNCMAF